VLVDKTLDLVLYSQSKWEKVEDARVGLAKVARSEE
jgi:hypothetical protein